MTDHQVLSLISSIARRYLRYNNCYGLHQADLEGAGYRGYLISSQSWREDGGMSYRSWIYMGIRHGMRDEVKARRELGYRAWRFGRNPSTGQYNDEITEHEQFDIHRACEIRQDMERMGDAAKVLSAREMDIVWRRGAMDEGLREIGAVYGITRERVRQIYEGALEKLRAALEAEYGII